MSDLFRVYVNPRDGGSDVFDGKGYPLAWHEIKHLVRDQAGNRCLRCGHPYTRGDGEWSACDEHCDHVGPIRVSFLDGGGDWEPIFTDNPKVWLDRDNRNVRRVEAQWRVLTVHHLDGVKANCRWWNLVSLCQRCHLQIQRKVVLDQPWPWPHTEWFKPYAAAFYALKYLAEDIDRDETTARLDELLALGLDEEALERMPL